MGHIGREHKRFIVNPTASPTAVVSSIFDVILKLAEKTEIKQKSAGEKYRKKQGSYLSST